MSRRPPVSLTLKQKLSALSLAPSAPSSPAGPNSNQPPSPKLFSFGRSRNGGLFGFLRGDTDDDIDHSQTQPTNEERQRIDLVLEKLICQAGVDYETRPMVVITAAALPDPRQVNYDFLLDRIMSYLDLYVENDYSVVFLTAGGRHTPGWNWVWKAYRNLSRKYRKNLKHLYIVHSTWFSKMLFSLAGAIISPKFFRKIQYIATLSELAQNVPLTQIDIAPAVYQENLKHEQQITLPTKERTAVFGVPLEDLMGEFGENGGIPRVVKDCVEYLRDYGLEVDGLFRRSPNSVLLKQAQEAYDRGHPVSLSSFGDPHIAAVLLKKFLRDLPEPIFHGDLYPAIRRCPINPNNSGDQATISYIRQNIIPALKSDAAEYLLSYVLHLLHVISLRSSINRMDAHNLALCLCPNLLGCNPTTDVAMCKIPSSPFPTSPQVHNPLIPPSDGQTTVAMVLKVCIDRYFEVFEEVVDRSEGVPSKLDGSVTLSDSSRGMSSESATDEDGLDDDEDFDDAMLVMPLGPTSPTSAHLSPFLVDPTAQSPPTAWKVKHRRNRSAQSGGGSTIGGESMGTLSAPSKSRRRTPGGSRSVISIEKTLNGKNGTGSIALKNFNGGTTTRKPAGAGVEAVSITALGFFTPPSEQPASEATSPQADGGGKVVAMPSDNSKHDASAGGSS